MSPTENPILDPLPPGEKKSVKNAFFKGVLHVIAFYAAGFFLSWLTYSIVGHSYPHGPGLHHIIILFTFVGGLGWTFAAGLTSLTRGAASWKVRGVLVTNTLAILVFVFLMYNLINSESDPVQPQSMDEMQMLHKGDTAVLYHNNNIIYMRVRDSVLIDLIDSTGTLSGGE